MFMDLLWMIYVLDQRDFVRDEVQYNLIYRTREYEDAVNQKRRSCLRNLFVNFMRKVLIHI